MAKLKKKVYQDYLAYSHSSFEHIWLGRGYPNVGQEYLIPANSISRQEYSSKANMGIKNGRAKLNEDQIRDIRARYDNGERLKDIHALYDFVGYSTIFRVRTGRFIKILSEPVSTIPEVEMPGSRVTIGTWLGFRKRSL